MDKPRKPTLLLLVLLTTLVWPLAEPRSRSLLQAQESQPPSFTPPDTLAAGTTLRIDGDASMAGINRALAESFEARYEGSDVIFNQSGADAALEALISGDIELAALGRPLTDEEEAQNLIQVPVSSDKIAIIVSADNPFTADLTAEQFAQIFRGEITSWAELGGANRPLRFIDRPEASDIRRSLSAYDLFQAAPFASGANATVVEADSVSAVAQELGNDGISYALASEVAGQPNLRVLSLYGTLPEDDLYPYSKPQSYVYRGEASIPVEAFLGFAATAEGQQAVATAADAPAESAEKPADTAAPAGIVAVSPDGETLVRGTRDGQLQWLNGEGSPTGVTVAAHEGAVTNVAFTPDGQTVISTGADGTLQRWGTQANPLGAPVTVGAGAVTALAVSADGQTLATGSDNGALQRWAINGTPQGEPIAAHEGPIQAVAFNLDGATVLTGGADGVVNLWNPDGTLASKVADAHKGGVQTLAASTDDLMLVSGGADGTLRLWNAEGTPQPPIAAHDGEVLSVAFSPDGYIASTGVDQQLKRWSRNGTPLAGDSEALAAPATVAFKPDGTPVIATADGVSLAQPAAPTVDASGETDAPIQLPEPIAEVLERIGLAPESTWWIIPAIPLLLVIVGLIWALMGKKRPAEDEDDASAEIVVDAEPTPTTDSDSWGETDMPAPPAEGEFEFADTSGDRDVFLTGTDSSSFVDEDLESLPAVDEDAFSLTDGDGEDTANLELDGRQGYQGGVSSADEALFVEDVDATYPVGDLETAAEAETEPSSPLAAARADLREGQRLHAEGRYTEALDYFNDAAEAVEVERMKATAAGTDLGGVTALLTAALAGRGSALMRLARFEPALASLNRALELDSTSTLAWSSKGQALLEQGQADEALFCFDKALELDAGDAIATQGRAAALVQLGRKGEETSPLQPAAPPSIAREPATRDVPVELQQAVSNLPVEGDVISTDTSQTPLPAELQQAVAALPDQAQTPADVQAAQEAQLPPPEELDAVMEALWKTGNDDFATGMSGGAEGISPGAPVMLDGAAETAPDTELETRITPDNPDTNGLGDLADLPPEVLAALRGIPADSPDSFDLPETDGLTDGLGATPTPEGSRLSLSFDGNRFYASWTVSKEARLQAKQAGGQRLYLRLYNVSDGSETLVEEQECYELAEDWYLNLPEPAQTSGIQRRYQARLGYAGDSGSWWNLATSAPVVAP